jgi:hypothetical protein
MKKEISQRVQGPIKRICSFQVPLEIMQRRPVECHTDVIPCAAAPRTPALASTLAVIPRVLL